MSYNQATKTAPPQGEIRLVVTGGQTHRRGSRYDYLYRSLAGSQEPWQCRDLNERPHCTPDREWDTFWDRRQRMHEAQLKLAWMKRYEFLANRWEEVSERGGLSRGEVEFLRSKYAALYRDSVGVGPELRHDLRRALEQLAAQGDRTVDDVVAEVRSQTIDEWMSSVPS